MVRARRELRRVGFADDQNAALAVGTGAAYDAPHPAMP